MNLLIKNISVPNIYFWFAIILLTACERDLSMDAEFATHSTTAEVFTDTPIGLGSNFYFPFAGSKATAFSVDEETSYEGNASMRIDVPNADDPEGSYAGAIFRIEGNGRNLTQYDALTFWGKSSQNVSISEIGFGQDFGENKYQVTRKDIDFTTNWKKYIIPIPDASKLIEERGMFWYSAGGIGTVGQELGFTFWLDEIKFERLGTIGQPQPAIYNGEDINSIGFINVTIPPFGLTYTSNTSYGENITVEATPAYFNFESSNTTVATVNEAGIISVDAPGTTIITATLAGVRANGSYTLTADGEFDYAPTPPVRDPTDVVSIYSDAYNSVDLEYFNGFFTPDGQTTLGGNINVNGENVIRYTDLNFVALKTLNNNVDISGMANLHVDIRVEDEQIDSGDFIQLILLDAGPDATLGNSDDTEASVTFSSSDFTAGEWSSFDVPLSQFNGMNMSNISLVFFVSDFTISSILVDNIYAYN